MQLALIEKNSFSHSYYDNEEKIINFKIWGDIDFNSTKAVLRGQIEFAQDHKVLGICTDISELNGTIAPISGFIATEYFPTLISLGLLCNAIIVSREIFSQVAAKDLIKKMDSYGIKLFFEDHEAEQWLKHSITQNT